MLSDASFFASPNQTAFVDLPCLAIPGIESRLSRAASVASLSELSESQLAYEAPTDSVMLGTTLTAPLFRAAACAAISAFVCGLELGDLNIPASPMRDALGIAAVVRLQHGLVGRESALNDALWGLCVSALPLGALCGGLTAERLSTWRGRRLAIAVACGMNLIAAALHAAVALLCTECEHASTASLDALGSDEAMGGASMRPVWAHAAAAATPPASMATTARCVHAIGLLVSSRILSGLGVGLCSAALPAFLGELAPSPSRGLLGTAIAVASAAGITVAHAIGGYLVTSWAGSQAMLWAFQPACAAVLAVCALLLLMGSPESPVWLMMHGRPDSAARQLGALRRCGAADAEVAAELGLIAYQYSLRMPAPALASGKTSSDLGDITRRGGGGGLYQPPPAPAAAAMAAHVGSTSSGALLSVQSDASFETVSLSNPCSRLPSRTASLAEHLLLRGGASEPRVGCDRPPAVQTTHDVSAGMIGNLPTGVNARPPHGSDGSRVNDTRCLSPASARTLLAADAVALSGPNAHAAWAQYAAATREAEGASGRHGQRTLTHGYALLLCAAYMITQQLSGIGCASSYAYGLLRDASLNHGWSLTSVLAHDVAGVAITALAVRILDSYGRRALLTASLAATAGSLGLLSLGLRLAPTASLGPPLVCTSLALHAAAVGVGLGPIPWLLPNELLPVSWQRLGMRLITATHWLASFLAAQTFLPLCAALGVPSVLLPNLCVVLLTLGFAVTRTLETRGKTLDAIQSELLAPSR